MRIKASLVTWDIGSYNTQQSRHTEHAILSRKAQHDFPKMRGGSKAVLNFYRTQVSLVRSLCPDVSPSVTHLVQT